MLVLLMRGIWVFLAIRLLSWRSTIANRTFVTYMSLGALISFTAASVVRKVVNPDADPLVWPSFALNVGLQLLLLLPLWRVLRGKGPQRSLSIADGFLLAFALGFGFDLMGALQSVMAGAPAGSSVQLLPPGSLASLAAAPDNLVFAGYGLWAGLIVVAVIAARRFTRSRVAVWTAGLLTFLFCALDAPTYWKPWPFADLWRKATLHGSLAAWLSIAALLAASLYERRWARDEQSFSALSAQWRQQLQSLFKSNFGELMHRLLQWIKQADSRPRLHRRLQIAAAEARRDPGMNKVVALIRAQAQSDSAASGLPLKTTNWKTLWRQPWIWQSICCTLLMIILLHPATFDTIFANQILKYKFMILNESVLDTLLVTFLFWRYLVSAARQTEPGIDGALNYRAEKQIHRAVLWLAVLGWLYLNWNSYFPFPSLFTYFPQGILDGHFYIYSPNWGSEQYRTFLLLVAVCVSGTLMPSTRAWSHAPSADRRVSVVRHFMAAFTSCTLMYLATRKGNYYPWDMDAFWRIHGHQAYALSLHLGTNGNKLLNWAFALLNALYWIPLALFLGYMTRVAVSFFADPGSPRPGSKERRNWLSFKRATAGAGSVMPGMTIAAALHSILRLAFPHAALAGGCTSPDDCICVPLNIDDGLGPLIPVVDYRFYHMAAGGDGDDDDDDYPVQMETEEPGPEDLSQSIYDLKKQFEDLENQLSDEVNKQLTGINDYAQKYNTAWAAAMNNLNDYLGNKSLLQPAINQLAQNLANRSDVLRYTGILDQAVQPVVALAGQVAGALEAEAAQAAAKAVGGVPHSVPVEVPPEAVPERPPLPPDGPLPDHLLDPETPPVKPAVPETPTTPNEPPAVPETPTKPADPPAETKPSTPTLGDPEEVLPDPKPPAAAPDPAVAAREAAAQAAEDSAAARNASLPEGTKPYYTMDEANAISENNLAKIMSDNPNYKRATFLGTDPDMIVKASNVKPIPGMDDVFVHGAPDGQKFIVMQPVWGVNTPVPVSPSEMKTMIQGAGLGDNPIRLMSCSSGLVVGPVGPLPAPAAEQLSKMLSQPILAPQNPLGVLPDGGVVSLPKDPANAPKPPFITFGKNRGQ